MMRYRSPKSMFIQRMVLAAVLLLAGLGVLVYGIRLGSWLWLPGLLYVLISGLVVWGAWVSWRLSPYG